MIDPATCEHDPDDGGDTCCSCGKIMTEEDRLAYERRLRARVDAMISDVSMERRARRMFDEMFRDKPKPISDGE